MNPINPITAAVFSAFLKCPTKAHLLAIGEPAPGTFFTDIEVRISSMAHPGFRGDGATIASTSAVSSAFPRFLALCTNWKNAR
jgi:hypothetical protein